MFPHVLTLSLLLAPPSLASRLSLGVVPEPEPSSAPYLGEVAAGLGGVLLGHGISLGLAFAADHAFSPACDGDVCHSPSEDFVAFGVAEFVVVPLLASALAYAVRHEGTGSFLGAWAEAAIGHLLAAVLVIPGLVIMHSVPALAAAMVIAGFVGDLALTPVGASMGLHARDPQPAPTIEAPPPLPPPLQPPPRAELMLPLRFAF